MEEAEHKIQVLEGTKQAIEEKDSYALRNLSNQTVHCASAHQDGGSILTAVLIYSLSKLIERRDYEKIKDWPQLTKKISALFTEAIKFAMQNDEKEYEDCLQRARKTLEGASIDLKKYIQEVIKKAEINKASRIYEHGISMGQTAKLLGLTTWELAEYTGQSKLNEARYTHTLSESERAKTALEFFE